MIKYNTRILTNDIYINTYTQSWRTFQHVGLETVLKIQRVRSVKRWELKAHILMNLVEVVQLPWAPNIISESTVRFSGLNLLVSVNIKPILSAFEMTPIRY